MKQLFTVLLLGITQLLCSCNSADSSKLTTEGNNKAGEPGITKPKLNKNFSKNSAELLKDFRTWYNYTYYEIRLDQSFIGLNTDSTSIDKSAFLNLLTTGNFVALKISIKDNLPVYKLYKLTNADPDIKSTIKQMALTEIERYKMEGKELPNYNFSDLNGKNYNKTNTKGKILVIKCWFIQCVPCVKEFPELNKLVDEYKDRDDILFVSLAMDSKQDLNLFLSQKQFKYAVVPGKEEYMNEQLGITSYPTHILVDRNGKIVKVTNSISKLIPIIQKQIEKISS